VVSPATLPMSTTLNGRTPETVIGPRLTVRSHDEWLSAEIPPMQELVAGLVRQHTASYWHGRPASLKTWFALVTARAVASGRDLLGTFATIQSPVLILDAESHDAGLQDRLRMLQRADPLPPATPLTVATVDGLFLDDTAGWGTVDGLVRRFKPGLVIFDSSVRFHRGDENTSGGMADHHAALRALMRTHGSATVVLDHTRKAGLNNAPEQRQRGSGEKRGFVDSAIDFEPGKGRPPTVTVTPHKDRWGELKSSFVVRLEVDQDAGAARLVHAGAAHAADTRQHEVIAAVASLIAQGGPDAADARSVAFWLECSDDTAARYLGKAVKAGLLRPRQVKTGVGRPRRVYDLGGDHA
jgi:hypothetical protein